jgi:FtsP/CotA-like multicopper oxidase with cupredoxin domain
VASLELFNLEPDKTHTVHLHDAPCDVLDGGAHYYVDPAQSGVGEANELWVTLKANSGGYAKRAVGIPHVARADAQSFVVHAEDGARLACIDL